ncbi:MAG: c-type cytochrome [Candidatus Lloydbacteria bacterium]|nr:c-type cytochrome [Candidatus Lloydbacteria bacterium]
MKKSIGCFVLSLGFVFCVSSVSYGGGIEDVAKSCMACHKEGQTGKKPDLKTLSKKDFMEKMQEYKEDDGSFMGKKAKALSDQQIKDLADYFSKK